MDKKRFAIIGISGYVAPKHLKVISTLGHEVVAAMDMSDSVGILDSFFPHCQFFTSYTRFERFLYQQKSDGSPIDYLVVCTPNHLHDTHCRLGLSVGADVICEKPLVLNPWNVETLINAEKESGQRIANILQLRYHPEVIRLQQFLLENTKERYNVALEYTSPRGAWYDTSWKGDVRKSGGLITNIGVHLFDLLLWLFGPVKEIKSVNQTPRQAHGVLVLEKADVSWMLSTEMGQHSSQPVRTLTCDDMTIRLDNGWEDLHEKVYSSILTGQLIRPVSLVPLIQLMSDLRTTN